jgi:acyl-CoA synthetase (AMP-forming)/AMP-acid ligase II
VHLSSLLDIAADALGDRVAVAACAHGATGAGGALTYKELSERVDAVARHLAGAGAERLVAVDVNSEAVPIGLFGAARANIAYVPVNYRLADAQLRAILERAAPGLAVVEPSVPSRLGGGIPGLSLLSRDEFLAADGPARATAAEGDPEDPAVLLFTSGTTGEPKAAVLRHRHLTSYVLETVEFMGADPEDAALVSVPPYHIAGIAAVLSSVWSGRRLVYLPQFSAEAWVDLAAREAVTHAMVVPTMLGRILEVLIERDEALPALRHLSYGGGRMPMALVERALEQLPHVGLVNAYGLTETSSTIAVLGPEDHREAIGSSEPAVRHRLGSVGRPLPNLEVEIRDHNGAPLGAGDHGEIWVKGEQVSGEYLGRKSAVSADGWLATNDGGWLDEGGYLFVEGRLDDVIVRGGENLSPGEIEEVLLSHPAVADVAVIGVPDEEWGEAVAAVVVLVESADADADPADADSLRAFVAERLRSTRAPGRIEFRTELPYSETGKLLRRVLKAELAGANPTPTPTS